jgi:hypothetical protein
MWVLTYRQKYEAVIMIHQCVGMTVDLSASCRLVSSCHCMEALAGATEKLPARRAALLPCNWGFECTCVARQRLYCSTALA